MILHMYCLSYKPLVKKQVATAKFNMRHEYEVYYFRIVKCKKRFKKNRDKFVK